MTASDDIVNRFTYHPPSEERAVKHVVIRNHGRSFAEYLDEELPDGREKSIALTKIEEAVMWANASLARSPEK